MIDWLYSNAAITAGVVWVVILTAVVLLLSLHKRTETIRAAYLHGLAQKHGWVFNRALKSYVGEKVFLEEFSELDSRITNLITGQMENRDFIFFEVEELFYHSAENPHGIRRNYCAVKTKSNAADNNEQKVVDEDENNKNADSDEQASEKNLEHDWKLSSDGQYVLYQSDSSGHVYDYRVAPEQSEAFIKNAIKVCSKMAGIMSASEQKESM